MFYYFNGRNAARTCRRFGISRQTFYRWKRKFGRHDLTTLVQRSHRTYYEEFYQVHVDSDQVPRLNRQLRQWEHTYNHVRPHQSLAYLTPQEFAARWKLKYRKQSVTNRLDEYTSLIFYPTL